jgi:hypothetical protein
MGINSLLQQDMQNVGIAGIDRLAGNAMYPQSQQVNTQFATPTQMPTSSEVIRSDYGAVTNPYNGEPIRGFNAGGDIEDLQQVDSAPKVVDYKDQLEQLYQGVLGRSLDEGAKGWEDLLSAGYSIDEVARQIGASAEAKNKAISEILVSRNRGSAEGVDWYITEYARLLGTLRHRPQSVKQGDRPQSVVVITAGGTPGSGFHQDRFGYIRRVINWPVGGGGLL